MTISSIGIRSIAGSQLRVLTTRLAIPCKNASVRCRQDCDATGTEEARMAAAAAAAAAEYMSFSFEIPPDLVGTLFMV